VRTVRDAVVGRQGWFFGVLRCAHLQSAMKYCFVGARSTGGA
jgi:hypothetical protein